MKKIVVTGGAGYIGSHTTLALHDAGAFVFEERYLRVAAAEEIVPVAVVADAGVQFHAQEVAVEAHRLGHVVGDECQMVDARQLHGCLLNLPPII